MNINQNNINLLFNNYISFVDDLSRKNNYNDNVKNLLYILIPAFISKYGVGKEPQILNTFENILINIKEESIFTRELIKEQNEYKTNKTITIKPFTISSLSKILDSTVSLFNKAVNSINEEIIEDDNYIYVREGLNYYIYNKKDLSFIKKNDNNVFEELLNISQCEEILKIIASFKNYEIENNDISSFIYELNYEFDNILLESNAYYVQKQICYNLMNSKLLIPSVNKYRFKGNIKEIEKKFDDVLRKPNSYKKFNELLNNIHELIIKCDENKSLEDEYLNDIKELVKELTDIVKEYELKSIFR